MKTMLIGSKIELTTGIHLLRFSKSFLDLPGAAWFMYLLIYLFCSSKRGSKVRAAYRGEFSEVGFLSEVGDLSVSEIGLDSRNTGYQGKIPLFRGI
ncbi:hypothetical protein FEA48_11075 [Pseudomonas nitroreducens]|uniref:Uncharacterized protein n=1 Tax=Pseudomonas nitroreducens TaxID=46680 RepID=A0A5R9A7X7_PSENT|nr:hypothetical protein [Pseudomonas nitroreducens]TLP74748.1 hypothetical protein FEA48_11075 [Pseudomonas nitroreducens]